MEALLAANPDLYASLVFNSSDLIAMLTPEGVYRYVSNSAKTILGYELEELVGQNALSFIHPDDVANAAGALERMQNKQTIHLDPFRFRAKNGDWRWMDCVVKDMSTELHTNIIVTNTRDITEKVEAEHQLEMREAYYSSLFTNHPDGAFALTMDGVIINANPGLEPVLGLSKEKLIGRPYSDFIPPNADSKAADEAFLNALDGKSSTFETEALHEIKGLVLLSITTIPVVLNGVVMGVHGIAKDITKIRKAQTTIKEQAELLTRVFGSITEGFFVVDKSWKITYANPFFVTFFGLQGLPFKGLELWDVLPLLKASRFYEDCLQAAKSGQTLHFDDFFPERQQTLRFAVYPFSGGFTIYFDDISEQRKKEQELLDLSLVASRITNGVAIMNPAGKIEWVNDGFSRLTGYSRQEVIGQVPSKLLQGTATDPEVSTRIYQQYAAQVPFSQEVLNYKKNGEKIWFHIDVTPIFDENGRLVKYIAVENDITALKQKEEEMMGLTDNLLRRNEDLQQFTYIVSHNLRAPVANLLGLSRLLESERPESERFGKALRNLSAAVNHLDMVIDDLNKILSPQKNARTGLQEQVNVGQTLETVIAGLQEQLKMANATFENKLSEELVLNGSAAYFYSIFNNLISNAIKYRNPENALKITVNQQVEPHKVSVLVADNGLGIDLTRAKNQLFQLYKRFHPGTEGRGIGLYLVKTQTEAMGGTVEVQSQPGEGTTFKLTFSL